MGTIGTGIPVKVGQLAVTSVYLTGTAADPAVLLDVRPQHADDAHGLTIRYAATTGRGMHLGGERGWHPTRWDLRPISGFTIPAHKHASVVIGAAAVKPGLYLVRGFIVDYRIGGTRYSAPQQKDLEVCAGRRSCP